MNADPATVLDIVIACRRIERFLTGVEEAEFTSAEEKHWAVVSQLTLIGEAVRRLSTEFCDSQPQLPWRQIAGMRDRLIHAYDKINWSLVWKTAKQDVPRLLAVLEPLVPPEEPPST